MTTFQALQEIIKNTKDRVLKIGSVFNFIKFSFLRNFDLVDILSSILLVSVLINNYSYFLEQKRYLNLLGISLILAVAYIFSNNRSKINFRLVRVSMALHYMLGYAVLRTTMGHKVLSVLADGVNNLYLAADAGINFVFGGLANANSAWGFVFAFKVLPIIIFFGALMSLLFYMGIIQKIVYVINFFLQPILGTSGAETLCAIANSFLGQTESPLLIRNYLPRMTKSEYMVVMITGMGTISGSILAVFARMGVPTVHLLGASVMAIPATIMIAKILFPETEKPETVSGANVNFDSPAKNFLDAISIGTSDGLQLALNVGAMLIAFLALMFMGNSILGFVCNIFHLPVITLQSIFGVVFTPFAWLLGISSSEVYKAAELLGTKVSVNEMVAYSNMVTMGLSERTVAILTYALCGFANFSCIGIQIGGIGALAPEKRHWLSELGFKAVLGANLANLLSAMVAGLLI